MIGARTAALAATVALGFGVAACGGDDTEDKTEEGATTAVVEISVEGDTAEGSVGSAGGPEFDFG